MPPFPLYLFLEHEGLFWSSTHQESGILTFVLHFQTSHVVLQVMNISPLNKMFTFLSCLLIKLALGRKFLMEVHGILVPEKFL